MIDLTNIKESFLALCMIIATFIAPIQGMVLLVIMAIAADTTLGIYNAIRLKEYQSDKLFNVVVKTFFYSFSVLFAFIVSKVIFDEELFGVKYLSVKLVTAFWIYIEMKSIDETSQKLGNKPFVEIVRSLIKKAKEFKKDLNELKK
ncbi:MAG: phage holin family protein [Polaribacter sp.]|uniref:phage holin family protein n=1 Tax=Polaribacter sp. TaxID=1920175 RepID=UPI003EF176C6